MAIRRFPIGIQSFEKLREGGFLYVDKTAYVYKLVSNSVAYFLSRPRRFGKSLLLTTLEAYFLGKRELFKGLAIEELEKDWVEYPVLHMDLNAELYDRPESLDGIIIRHLNFWEDTYGADQRETSLTDRFVGIIRRAAEKTGKQVVVLIDEYDKPLLQAIGDDALGDAYREKLKAFYGVLKSMDAYLRFVFLTGVTKFGQVSVFSDLNQLKDISMDPRYGGVCGITGEELEENFRPELEALAEKEELSYTDLLLKMKRQFDGYHFLENAEGIYNPFSVLNTLDSQKFSDYWFATGTPTFLLNLLKRSDYDIRELEGVELTANAFSDYRANVNDPIPVIYQSGYLTIKKYDSRFKIYTLGFPNEEVRYGFLNFLLPFYTGLKVEDNNFYIGNFIREIEAGQVERFLTRLESYFASIPYELNDKSERHYQTVFYLLFSLMGQFVEAEVRSCRGRADAVVKTANYIYVLEFKLDGTPEEALVQIDEKGYLVPYTSDQRQLIKIGIAFSTEKRNIDRWLVREE